MANNRNNLVFKRDGQIKFEGVTIGTWKKVDIWARHYPYNGHDISGNKLVHYVWSFKLESGKANEYCYTKQEMIDNITVNDITNSLKAINRKPLAQ